MAIRIIEGCIGSGKTYYAVWHIMSNYFKYDNSIDNYTPKDTEKPVFVYSNIDRFLLSESLEDKIKDAGGLESFFNSDYQKEFCRGRKVIYLIDEAQGPAFFHRKFYNPNVFFFFQYHRHYGCDVYLITQDVDTLAKELRNLAEYHIKAMRRTYSMIGEFKYKFCSPDGESFRTKVLQRDKKIFSLYSSMAQEETEKMPSASRRYAVIFVALIILSGVIFRYGFLSLFSFSKADAKQSIQSSVKGKDNTQSNSNGVSIANITNPKNDLKVLEDKGINHYLNIVQNKSRESIAAAGSPLQTGEFKNDDVVVQKKTYKILGYVSVPKIDSELPNEVDSYNSYFLYEDENGITKKIKAFNLDSICKCNSIASIIPGIYEF